ncbi:hypothetical protein GCM10023172_39170 [Hymenobacter ginsengisoli]|uniref:FecR N-terminal domain-containing protein n=1 Tax=Hymenobacter ginsengisoli TaxID=1051626 RepID=A0ABP8QRL3_9BACT|nr:MULTISPECIES: hypothetical protein [unclassified Hymenobacter]MBO2032949.1 hypothetical protein [Hymenobacter sp. BT559]
MPNPDLRPGSDAEWQELLARLRRQPPPEPRPFFYARVQARLQAERTRPLPWLASWLRRPAYVVLLAALLLAVSGDGTALRAAPVASHPGQLSPTPTR